MLWLVGLPYDVAADAFEEEFFDAESPDELFVEESELFVDALAASLFSDLELLDESEALTEADEEDRESVL